MALSASGFREAHYGTYPLPGDSKRPQSTMQRNDYVLGNNHYQDEAVKLAKVAYIGLRHRLDERKPLPKRRESLEVNSVEWFRAWRRRCPDKALADADSQSTQRAKYYSDEFSEFQ
eukprot:4892278-Amphidinium_carterae.1